MTPQQEEYFKLLYDRRTIITKAAEDPASEKIWDGLIDKYTDNAHFVYELLQNASDAGASKARFELHQDKLLFAHNGRIHFTITDPEITQEKKAKANGTLGSVNAITSIGNSTKKNIEAKIGKFGIGFKAIYRYTETPYIYSPGGMFFRLEKKILPVILHDDYPSRQLEETLFVLPFNSEYTSAEKAYAGIEKRLDTLLYPTLFLNELNEVTCSIGNRTIIYSKSVDSNRSFSCNGIDVQFVQVTGKEEPERLWLLSRKQNGLTYSIGFFVGNDGNLVPKDCPAFCYFPTREQTGLKFIVHAPFMVNESREGIKEDDEHNKSLMTLLSSLAADAIECMGEMTQDDGSALLSDTILDIIPLTSISPSGLSTLFSELYKCVYGGILETFRSKKNLPGQNGGLYDKSHSACSWDGKLRTCFSEKLLSELFEQEMHWVFVNTENASDKHSYVSNILQVISYEDIVLKISRAFIEKQSFEWLHKFYAYINDNKQRVTQSKTIPILLDSQKKAFSAYNSSNEAQIYLPPENSDDTIAGPYHFVHQELLSNKETRSFLTALGVKPPKQEDYYDKVLLPRCEGKFNNLEEAATCLVNILKDYDKLPYPKKHKVDEILNRTSIFVCKELNTNEQRLSSVEHVYYPDKELIEYFDLAECKNVLFVDVDYYNRRFQFTTKQKEDFERHLQRINFLHIPELVQWEEDICQLVEDNILTQREANKRTSAISKTMDGMIDILFKYTENSNFSPKASYLLWHFLEKTLQQKRPKNGLQDIFYLITKGDSVSDKTLKLTNCKNLKKLNSWYYLLETEWLVDCNGKFRKPCDITKQELSEKYEMGYDSDVLIRNLGIKEALVVSAELSPEEQEIVEFIINARKRGFSMNNIRKAINDMILKKENNDKKQSTENISNEQENKANSLPAPSLPQQIVQQPADTPLPSSNTTQSQNKPTDDNISIEGNAHSPKKLTEEQKLRVEEKCHDQELETPPRVESTTHKIKRNVDVRTYVLERDKGICQLCGKPGPFILNGRYFLEVHHIIMLANGGPDIPENAVALCPNCHRKMHKLNLPEDVKTLQEKVSKRNLSEPPQQQTNN